jgi:hypothetical protein
VVNDWLIHRRTSRHLHSLILSLWGSPIVHFTHNWLKHALKSFSMENNNKQETGIDKFINLSSISQTALAKELKIKLLGGEISPLQTYVALRRIQAMVELTIDSSKGDKDLKEFFKKEVSKALDSGKSIEVFGASLAVRNTGTRHVFTECGDTVLNEMERIHAELTERIKARKETIKGYFSETTKNSKLGIVSKKVIQEGIPTLEWSEDEFEETIFPHVTYGGESIFCTFKQK